MPDGFDAINELVEKSAKPQETVIPEEKKDPPPDQKVEEKKPEEQVTKPEEKTEEKPAETVDPLTELLKETEFESREALVEHLKKKDKKVESPEEIKRKEQVYRANLNQFAVENSIMSNEDIVKLETLKGKADKDLVFEKYAGEVREEITEDAKYENPEITETEIEEKIKEAFDKEFPLESKNQKAKTRAEAKLAKEAKEIRGPLQSSFTDAQTRFDEEVAIRNAYPEYKKSVVTTIDQKIPKSFTFYSQKEGDQDIGVEVPVSDELKKEVLESLSKKLLTAETYALHSKGMIKELSQIIDSEVEYTLWKKLGEEGKKRIAETFESRGISKGSTVGSKNSFPTNQGKPEQSTKQNPADAQQQVIDSTRQKSNT